MVQLSLPLCQEVRVLQSHLSPYSSLLGAFVLPLALSKETSTIPLVFHILLILQGLMQIPSPHS